MGRGREEGQDGKRVIGKVVNGCGEGKRCREVVVARGGRRNVFFLFSAKGRVFEQYRA